MPNALGGNKYKRGRKGTEMSSKANKIQLKEADALFDYYAKVTKSVGDGRFYVQLVDPTGNAFLDGEFTAILPGRMKKGNRSRNWVTVHDYLLVTKRDPSSSMCKIMEIVLKYSSQAASQLERLGLVPTSEGIEFSLDVGITGSAHVTSVGGAATTEEDGDADEWTTNFDDI